MSLLEVLKQAQASGRTNDAGMALIYNGYIDEKARETGYPRAGIFELTPRCNFDCKMCYVHLNKEQMGGVGELPGKTWISLIGEAIENGMIRAQLTGGEAMMHPDFDDIYLHLYENGITASVLTNGLLLNEKRVEFFKKHVPGSIQVTMYGTSEEGYERLCGIRAYEVVKKNILNARSIGTSLSVSMTPSRYFTAEDVEKTIAFAKENDIRCRVNGDLYAPREGTDRSVDDMELSYEEEAEIARIRLAASGREVKSFQGELPQPGSDETVIGEDGYARGVGCASGRSLFCINWKGEMMACLDLMVKEKPLEIGFKEAWRRVHEGAINYIVPMECQACPYASVCNPCPVLHAKGASAGHADKRICERTRRFVAEGLLKI